MAGHILGHDSLSAEGANISEIRSILEAWRYAPGLTLDCPSPRTTVVGNTTIGGTTELTEVRAE